MTTAESQPTSPAPSSSVTEIAWSDDARRAAFAQWLAVQAAAHGLDAASVRPASADASFRRYFRVDAADGRGRSLIIMDAPPSHEDCRPFVQVAGLLGAAGRQAASCAMTGAARPCSSRQTQARATGESDRGRGSGREQGREVGRGGKGGSLESADYFTQPRSARDHRRFPAHLARSVVLLHRDRLER